MGILACGLAAGREGRAAHRGPGEPRHVGRVRSPRAALSALPSRAVVRRPLAIAALLCVLAPPAAALAQSPFSPLPQAQQPTQTATTTTGNTSSNNGDSGGLSSWQEILI